MAENEIPSDAFYGAELRSERVRIYGVLTFLAVVAVVLTVRVFLLHTTVLSSHVGWTLALAATVGLYEYTMLGLVNRALRENRTFPRSVWITSTVLETTVPAIGVAWLTSRGFETPYRPLASPATLLFFVFIILSILRLDRWICRLAGITAAASYLAAAVYLGWLPPTPGHPAPVTQTDVSLYAVILLVSGFVAGGVAGEIRKHVEAALREVETRRQLDRVQHDLKTAREIQQALLPQTPPEISGVAVAGWNKPADDTGGDFYDWVTLADGRLIVVLGDVTGHGIGPALLAAACRAYARSGFAVHSDLLSAVTQINGSIARDLDPTRFVTFASVSCAPGTGELEVLSAGHGPIILYSAASDSFREIDSQGVPLGILPELVSGPPTKIPLERGDIFLLITDGFVEFENPAQEEFGKKRLEEAVRASRALLPAQIIKALYDAVIAFSKGTHQQDDLTAVLIKRV
ncbi:MAG TPA: PP2C family protein-serine/threonine phosphatase [Candidatus Eisenbacteria bacterium]|nr:PP2C family protein-serine/threonine phosphatase [Candidatus Eisenbacteria bacterium]